MSAGNERFNDDALDWDANPFVDKASAEALEAILKARPDITTSTPIDSVLEIGCGTGLLTLRMAPYARYIVAVDQAEGMIAQLQKKVDAKQLQHQVAPLAMLLNAPEDLKGVVPASFPSSGFDLVTSHLVLHHIADLSAIVAVMFSCLRSGGQVALTDFEDTGPEAVRFHDADKVYGVERHGIPAVWMADLLKKAGFVDVHVRPVWSMDKDVEGRNGGPRETLSFPFLLCQGTKP